MVQCQDPVRELGPAILAGEVVPDIHVLTAEPDGSEASGSDIVFQTHNRGELKARADTAGKDVVVLDHFDLALEPKNEGLLP